MPTTVNTVVLTAPEIKLLAECQEARLLATLTQEMRRSPVPTSARTAARIKEEEAKLKAAQGRLAQAQADFDGVKKTILDARAPAVPVPAGAVLVMSGNSLLIQTP